MMRLAKFAAALAAASMIAVPALAAPSNPAAKLSIAKSARAGTASAKKNALGGSGILIAVIASAAIVAGIIIIADETDGPDSG